MDNGTYEDFTSRNVSTIYVHDSANAPLERRSLYVCLPA